MPTYFWCLYLHAAAELSTNSISNALSTLCGVLRAISTTTGRFIRMHPDPDVEGLQAAAAAAAARALDTPLSDIFVSTEYIYST